MMFVISPIIARRGFGRHETIGDILLHLLGCAPAWVAIAGAARRLQDEAVTRRDHLQPFALQFASGAQAHAAARTGVSTRAALRGMVDPLEHGKEREGRGMAAADLDAYAQSATEFS